MFLLHELTHITLSLIVGWFVFRFTKNYWVYFLSFVGGVFLDFDHFYDYFHFKSALVFNYEEFVGGKYFDLAHKVILPFHGYEFALIILLIGLIILFLKKNKKNLLPLCLIALSTSMFLHLIYDQLYYKPKPLTYSILYRISVNFDHDSLGFKKDYEK